MGSVDLILISILNQTSMGHCNIVNNACDIIQTNNIRDNVADISVEEIYGWVATRECNFKPR